MKFGVSQKDAKQIKLNFGKASQKSNLLEPMSENASVYNDGVENLDGDPKNNENKSPARSHGADSGSEMMHFENEPHSDNEHMN